MAYKQWDLYTQQPIALFHPALEGLPGGSKIFLAGVTKFPKGVVLWNLDYIINANIPGGQPGSGFADTPVDGDPVFDGFSGMWILKQRNVADQVYRMALPSEVELVRYETWRQYVPSIEKLQEQTINNYGD